jgi:hypothetical protein
MESIVKKHEPKQMNGPRNSDHLGAKKKRTPPRLPEGAKPPSIGQGTTLKRP